MYIVVRATEGKRTIGGGRGQARCCSALKRGSKSRTAWHGEGNRKQQWRQWRMMCTMFVARKEKGITRGNKMAKQAKEHQGGKARGCMSDQARDKEKPFDPPISAPRSPPYFPLRLRHQQLVKAKPRTHTLRHGPLPPLLYSVLSASSETLTTDLK